MLSEKIPMYVLIVNSSDDELYEGQVFFYADTLEDGAAASVHAHTSFKELTELDRGNISVSLSHFSDVRMIYLKTASNGFLDWFFAYYDENCGEIEQVLYLSHNDEDDFEEEYEDVEL